MARRTSRGTRFLMQAAIVSFAAEVNSIQTAALALQDQAVLPGARAESPAPATATSVAQLSLEELQQRIAASSGKDRSELLEQLQRDVRDLPLTNDQIDAVIEQLRAIEKEDPYQEARWGKVRRTPENARMIFVNRGRATRLIEELGYRKITNELPVRPIEQRILALMEYVEGKAPGKYESNWFSVELYRLGSDAVPPIIERMQRSADHDRVYAQLLSQIGDPRGVDAMVQALRRTPTDGSSRRCDLIHYVGAFEGFHDQWKKRLSQRNRATDLSTSEWRKTATAALIEVLRSEVRVVGDARMRQQLQMTQHRAIQPRMFSIRLYPMRQCAAEALSSITDKHWGMLFNEDHATWQAWSSAAEGRDFDPLDLPRTDQELATLIENFTYRCMHEYMRVRDWDRPNLHEYSTLKIDIARLVKLGPRAVTMLVDTCHSITAEFPVWSEELRLWTIRLLEAMDTPEAREAAKKLAT